MGVVVGLREDVPTSATFYCIRGTHQRPVVESKNFDPADPCSDPQDP